MYGFGKISRFKNQPCNRLYPKNRLKCIGKAACNDAVPWLNETISRIFRPTANFENFEIYLYFVCQPASLPAVRPGCAKCRASETSHDKGNGGGFTKMFNIPKTIYPLRHGDSLYPSFLSLFFISKVRISPKVTIACNGFCLLHHTKTWLARDIISYSGTMFSRVCVLACTLLHRELRDYSLGQIAFAVFRALLAITQLLCHVSALLTSACKQV